MILSAEFQVHRKLDMVFTSGFSKEKNEFVQMLINGQKNLVFDMWEFGTYIPKVEIVKSKSHKKEIIEYADGFPVIRIEIEVDASKETKAMLDYYNMDVKNGVDFTFLSITHTSQIALTLFERNIQDVFVAGNIANPGTLYMSNIVYRINENKIISKYCLYADMVYDSVLFCFKKKYPPILNVGFFEVWNWLRKFKEYKRGYSANSVERSLNCLNALFQKKESEALFFAIMGIEALYLREDAHSMNQVIERSQLLLGCTNEGKTLYGDMYNQRSKYIHGQLNFAFNGMFSNFIEEQRVQRHIDGNRFAIGILISSIQHLCIQGRTELEFETSIKD